MPTVFAPMAATLSATLPPDDDRWGYEIKWDGVRALAFGGPGRIRLYSRTERDITVQYPEIQPIEHQLGDHTVVLDGELVAFDDDGRPSFQRLQPRMHVTSESEIRTRQREVPVTYIVFDLLHLDGRSLFGEPYEERRRLLEELRLDGPNWQAPPYQRGDGAALLAATRAQRLEGVVAKRLTSKYRPGRRSTEWLKIKNVLRQEVVIGGWLPGQGRLEGELGSLLVGYHEPDGTLAFAGKVGTGFDDATRRMLKERLAPVRIDASPFTGRQPQQEAIFVEPSLVCEVEFAEWTSSGTMRHPSYQGLREDKPARDVVREVPRPA
ncbi:MAG TPA: non-homologous end-joining DNA ligase [Jiangellaceae bacterium]